MVVETPLNGAGLLLVPFKVPRKCSSCPSWHVTRDGLSVCQNARTRLPKKSLPLTASVNPFRPDTVQAAPLRLRSWQWPEPKGVTTEIDQETKVRERKRGSRPAQMISKWHVAKEGYVAYEARVERPPVAKSPTISCRARVRARRPTPATAVHPHTDRLGRHALPRYGATGTDFFQPDIGDTHQTRE